MPDETNYLKQIGEGLESIFRFMLPGLCILIAFVIGRPKWAAQLDYHDLPHLTLIAGTAVAIGNAWYVLHRYSVHQLIDYALYAYTQRTFSGYSGWLANHIERHYQIPPGHERLITHLYVRSAQVIFLYIVCESVALSVFGAEDGTIYHNHKTLVLTACMIAGLFAVVQQAVLFRVDLDVVNKYSREGSAFQR